MGVGVGVGSVITAQPDGLGVGLKNTALEGDPRTSSSQLWTASSTQHLFNVSPGRQLLECAEKMFFQGTRLMGDTAN